VGNGFLAERTESPGESRFVAMAAPARPSRSRGDRSARTIARARRCGCGEASASWSGSAEDGAQLSATVGIEVVQGLAPTVSVGPRRGCRHQPGDGGPGGRLGVQARRPDRHLPRAGGGRHPLVVSGEAKTPARGQRTRAASASAARRARDRRPWGSRSWEPARSRSSRPAASTPRTRRTLASRSRTRRAVARGLPFPSAGRQGGPRAVGQGFPLQPRRPCSWPTSRRARYQVLLTEEGKDLVRARYRGSQQPAELPGPDPAGGRRPVERVGVRSSGAAGTHREGRPPAAAREGTRGRRRPGFPRRGRLTWAAAPRGRSRDAPSLALPPSISRCRAPASWFDTRRAFD
jgi:hypothetical protein